MLLVLLVYALGWQQVIKRIPLTLAFMNKAVTIVWGILWGFLLFGEQVNVGKVVGAILVIAGVVLFAKADDGQKLSDGGAVASNCNGEAPSNEAEGSVFRP